MPVTFLHLPAPVRDDIYRRAGLFTDAVVRIRGRYDLPHGCPGRSDLDVGPHAVNPRKSVVPISSEQLRSYRNLRRVSRAARDDAARFLYTHNEVMVRCIDAGELSLLLEAPSHLIHSFRHLTVLLNVASMPFMGEPGFCHVCRSCPYAWRLDQKPLTSSSRRTRSLLLDWQRVVRRLATSGNRSALRLYVACDVADVAVASQVTGPLEGLGLAACTVRLGGYRDDVLEDVARRATLVSTGGLVHAPRPFRFLDLPAEIRQHILGYTDVVSPFHEVEWAPHPPAFRLPYAWRRPFSCPSRDFCSLNHAAFPRCACWTPPTPLFLVCRSVLQDARAVFYRSNRFIVLPGFRSPNLSISIPFSASVFLSRLMSQGALHHLRTLEIVFSAAAYNGGNWDEHAWLHWAHIVKSMASRTNRLALRLYMGHNAAPLRCEPYPRDVRSAQEEFFKLHERIVEPFAGMKALDYLFLEVATPFEHPVHLWDVVGDEVAAHEKRIRHIIMGDRPDAEATERSQGPRSGWLSFPLDFGLWKTSDDSEAMYASWVPTKRSPI